MSEDRPEKIIQYRISNCRECRWEIQHIMHSECCHEACREDHPIMEKPWGGIPSWCPLADAPKQERRRDDNKSSFD